MKGFMCKVLRSFQKLHIVHHAGSRAVFCHRGLRELRGHGCEVSLLGMFSPLLNRREERGRLTLKVDPKGRPRAGKEYSLTTKGKGVLAVLRTQVKEPYCEVVLRKEKENSR